MKTSTALAEQHERLWELQDVIWPDVFDILSTKEFFDKHVPLEMKLYSLTPEAMTFIQLYSNLSLTAMKIMLYLHKLTIGFMQSNPKDVLDKCAGRFPMGTVHAVYGEFHLGKSKNRRSRFYSTSAKEIGGRLRIDKAQIVRGLKELIEFKLLQKFEEPHRKTNYGINYFTIEAIFGGYSALFEADKCIKQALQDDLITFEKGKITGIKFCLENYYRNSDTSTKRVWKELPEKEKIMLRRIFKGNHFTIDQTYY